MTIMVINSHTVMIKSGNARMTVTFTTDKNLVTTHEYDRALVKRVSVVADKAEALEILIWLANNLGYTVAPTPQS